MAVNNKRGKKQRRKKSVKAAGERILKLMEGQKSVPKTCALRVRLTAHEMELLDQLAEYTGASKSYCVRAIIYLMADNMQATKKAIGSAAYLVP